MLLRSRARFMYTFCKTMNISHAIYCYLCLKNREMMKRYLSILTLSLMTVTIQAQDLKKEWTRNFDERRVPAYTLPDPLLCENGQRVTTVEQWEQHRRPELIEMLKTYMYGHAPLLKHPLRFKVEQVNPQFQFKEGKKEKQYASKQVTVYLTNRDADGPTLNVKVLTPKRPNAEKTRYPAFMLFSGVNAAQRLLDRGYGVVVFNPTEAVADGMDAFKTGLIPAYYDKGQTYRRPDEWGCLAAWAWEASRVMDYLQTDADVDARRVAILGHSRMGKAALWTAVQDERFAMAFPVNSGCGGGALSRRMVGETVWAMNDRFPYWVCDNFQQFNMREEYLPFDQHTVIALMAPRPVYLATGQDDAWADPLGEFLAGKAAESVYDLYGLPGIGCDHQPATDMAMNKGYIAYHIRTGGHAILDFDWQQFLDYADRMMGSEKDYPTSVHSLEQADQQARQTLAQMTVDEKLQLIDGKGFDIQPIERLGIRKIHMYDGPIGVRGTKAGNASYPSNTEGAIAERLAPTNSTAYPASVMLAATWNPSLAHDYGYALGRDSRARGINIILGPGVNIYRSPRNSRNFEYMGEDPVLTSRMAVEYIKGVQDNPGVIACVKHFAANNPESGRYDVSSDVDERTLQEIYLPAFRAAVEEGHVGSVMSSYNRIWGTWTSEHQWLMHDVLRDEWKFPFISMTDWGAAHHTDVIVRHGVDLEMPGGQAMTAKKIKPLLDKGELDMADIDKKVLNILRTCYYFNLYSYDKPDLTIPLDSKENAEVAYNVAKEGFVLLKNEPVQGGEPILPINPSKTHKICITGHNALDYVSGGGSSICTPFRKVSAFDAISAECKRQGILLEYRELEENPSVVEQCCFADEKAKKQGIKAEYYFNQRLDGEPAVVRMEKTVASPWLKKPLPLSKKETFNVDNAFSARFQTWVKVAETGDYLFSVSGDDGFRMYIDGECVVDDWHDGTARLHTKQLALQAGRIYPVVVEYFQSGGGCSVDFKLNRIDPQGMERIRQELQQYDMVLVCEGFDKNLEAEGGDRTFELPQVREAVLRAVAQSGVPAVAIINAGGNVESRQWEPQMAGLIWAWYAGQEGNRALSDILFGKVNPSGKLPMTFEHRAEDNPSFTTYSDQGRMHVAWTEGVFTGYRGYEKNGVEPLYPFGFGLSYTTFTVDKLQVATDNDTVKVQVNVTNTGQREGDEVIQVYVGKDMKDVLEDSPVLRPAKELKVFRKVRLKPGQQQTVVLKFPKQDCRYYDVSTHQWRLMPGRYNIMVGTSVRDIHQQQIITL